MTDIVERLQDTNSGWCTDTALEAADVIENQRNRLEAYKAGIPSDISRAMIKVADEQRTRIETMERELAAAQAREKVLRDALIDVGQALAWRAFGDCRQFSDKAIPSATDAIKNATAALAQPTNDTALKAALANERELCAKFCDAADKSTHPADLAEGIRAMEDE